MLPSKEQNVFKSVVRLYETKQLKKALKAADSILKKHPDHGETLAMKGLTLNALDKKFEATDFVRKGLRMDMRSHICWHVYGLLYRSERDYREAAKAYLNALRIDADNQQILRDLALLQVQIRDYDGLEDTRRRLLTVRPNQRINWIGFALSYHLLRNYSSAVSVLDTYEKTLDEFNNLPDNDTSPTAHHAAVDDTHHVEHVTENGIVDKKTGEDGKPSDQDSHHDKSRLDRLDDANNNKRGGGNEIIHTSTSNSDSISSRKRTTEPDPGAMKPSSNAGSEMNNTNGIETSPDDVATIANDTSNVRHANHNNDKQKMTLTRSEDRYEASELALYKNMVLEESGLYSEALVHLDQVADKLVDHLAVYETKSRLHAALGNYEMASDLLHKLIGINPDNYSYHHALHSCELRTREQCDHAVDMTAVQATPKTHATSSSSWQAASLERSHTLRCDCDVTCVLNVCDDLSSKFPFSRTACRIALDVLPNNWSDQFLARIDAYVRPFLRKGIPSLFSNVKSLYVHSPKAAGLGTLFESYLDVLVKSKGLHLPPLIGREDSIIKEDGSDEGTCTEPPCTLLWVLHFLAQHYDKIGDKEKALSMIDRAIEHTPTAIECYLAKARLVKHCGDLKGSVVVLNEARNLDLADRYLNTKCCKYALQADMIEDAESWISLFTRDGDSGGLQALYDMQCMWFELGAAESHLRRGQLALALKKFTAVDRHFMDMIEDQFDFHSYCLRKVTLRAYVGLLRYEDQIRRHSFYSRSCAGILRCLLKLIDMSEKERLAVLGEHADIKGYTEMSDAQRRKAVSKRRKQMAKKNQQKQCVRDGSKMREKLSTAVGAADKNGDDGNHASEGKGKANPGWMDLDCDGSEHMKRLLKPDVKPDGGKELFREAVKVSREMEKYLGHEVETQALCFQVAMKRQKYLQALRCVVRAMRIDSNDVRTVMMRVQLAIAVDGTKMSSAVEAVIRREGNVVVVVDSWSEVYGLVSSYEETNARNVEKLVGACRIRFWIASRCADGCDDMDEACQLAIALIGNCKQGGTGSDVLTPRMCKKLMDELRAEGCATQQVLDCICTELRSKFPLASF